MREREKNSRNICKIIPQIKTVIFHSQDPNSKVKTQLSAFQARKKPKKKKKRQFEYTSKFGWRIPPERTDLFLNSPFFLIKYHVDDDPKG